jgi:hypothetical protein
MYAGCPLAALAACAICASSEAADIQVVQIPVRQSRHPVLSLALAIHAIRGQEDDSGLPGRQST